MESKHNIKNVVLVHGAFADGSGWEAVANILKNDGYKVSVAQPPETSYAEDQKYTKAAIDAMGGPVVLVGHSYGGSIITEAGNHPNVAALVYIAAFALDEGESCASIEQALPQASKAFKSDSNGNWWIDQEHVAADFAADIPPGKAAFMALSQVPILTTVGGGSDECRLRRTQMKDRITIEGRDGTFYAHIARPKTLPASAVVVLQELFGVNADVRKTCDELAEQGFVAVAPDLFWRQEPGVDLSVTSEADWQHGLRLYQSYDRDPRVTHINDTFDPLPKLPLH